MTTPTYQALTLEERLQLDQDLRALRWQTLKAKIEGQLPADLKRIQDATHSTCGGMLFELETGTRYCLNCGVL